MTSNKDFFIPHADSIRLETTRRDRFNVLLRRIGMSQNALADEVGVSRGTMSKVANGDWFPASDVMTRICKILEVPSHVLFGDSSHWKHHVKKMIYVQEQNPSSKPGTKIQAPLNQKKEDLEVEKND